MRAAVKVRPTRASMRLPRRPAGEGVRIALLLLLALWPGVSCVPHDSGEVTPDAPAGGTPGSGGDGGDDAGPSEPPVEASCPPAEPVPNTACDRAGMRCNYDIPQDDFLCTRDGVWKRRMFVPGEGGGPGIPMDQPEAVDCSEISFSECDMHSQCSSVWAENAAFCDRNSCAYIPVEDCPAERCQVIPDCTGEPRCWRLPEPSLPCASPGASRDQGCCVGLTERCGSPKSDSIFFYPEAEANECHERRGAFLDFDIPLCLPCGDGTCEDNENHCNCPEDCEVPE